MALTDTPSSYAGQAAEVAAVNTGEDALEFTDPPAAIANELNTIEPQLFTLVIDVAWTELDLTHAIHPDATGIIFCVINTDIGAERYIGLRAKGSASTLAGVMKRHTHTWGLCPVSEDRKIEYYAPLGTLRHLWIMGYTGPNVHFLEPPVDVTPPNNATWTLKDLASDAPGAKAVILDVNAGTDMLSQIGARCNGSTDNRVRGCGHSFPVIKCDDTQKIELYLNHIGAGTPQVHLIGYITDNITMETNAINISFKPPLEWGNILVNQSYATPKFAFIELDSDAVHSDMGAQKRHSLRDILYDGDGHNWIIVHCNEGWFVELWRDTWGQTFFLQGVSH